MSDGKHGITRAVGDRIQSQIVENNVFWNVEVQSVCLHVFTVNSVVLQAIVNKGVVVVESLLFL